MSTGAVGNVGSNGSYWSASAYSTANGYRLLFTASVVYPNDTLYRAYGFVARCVSE